MATDGAETQSLNVEICEIKRERNVRERERVCVLGISCRFYCWGVIEIPKTRVSCYQIDDPYLVVEETFNFKIREGPIIFSIWTSEIFLQKSLEHEPSTLKVYFYTFLFREILPLKIRLPNQNPKRWTLLWTWMSFTTVAPPPPSPHWSNKKLLQNFTFTAQALKPI